MLKRNDIHKIFDSTNITIALCVLFFCVVLFFSVFIFAKTNRERLLAKSLISQTFDEKRKTDPFKDIEITAKSAYVWDIKNSKALFEINAEDKMPIASITKVMTALIVYENYSGENLNIEADSLIQEGDNGLLLDEIWDLKELAKFSLIVSSNDGAHSLSNYIGLKISEESSNINPVEEFVRRMNKKARELGLKNTYFKNESGLDKNENKAGAISSAKDVSLLMEYAIKNYSDMLYPTSFDSFSFRSLSGTVHLAINTNTETDKIIGLMASKTGFTDIAGGNLTIVFDPVVGRPIVVSVLGSTYNERFNDALKLVEATMEYLNH